MTVVILRFGDFMLDAKNRVLSRGGDQIEVQPKVFDCLELLASRSGELVTTEQLRAALWDGVHVGPDALRRIIREVRRALGDSGPGAGWIRTRKGYGYVFTADAVVREANGAAPAGAAPLAATPWPFVGRSAEIEALGSALVRGGERGGAFCFVAGAAGAGKSRLLGVVERELADRVVWVTGRCREGAGARPFEPFREVAAQLGKARAFASRLREERERRLPRWFEAEGRDPAADAESRFLVCAAFVDLVAALSEVARTVVAIEDVHWADDGTLLLVEMLGRASQDHGIGVISTYRPEEAKAGGRLSELIGRTAGRDGVTTVTLGPLATADLRHLLVLLRHPAGEGGAAALARLTGGNPLFVQQVLAEPGTDIADESAEPAGSIHHVVAARVGRLPASTRSVLAMASVLGTSGAVSILAAAEECEPHDVLSRLGPAVFAGLIEVDASSSAFRFRHALLRDALYASLSGPEKELAHRAALRAWRAAPDGTERACALASHAFLAGNAVSAREVYSLCEVAGRTCLRDLAFDLAVLHLGRALVLSTHAESAARAELSLLHARARLQADHPPPQVSADFVGTANIARAAGATGIFAEAAIGAVVGEDSPLELAFQNERHAEVSLLDEALASLGPDARTLRHRVARVLAWLRAGIGDVDAARAAAREALAAPPDPGDVYHHVLALGLECMDSLWNGDVPRAKAQLVVLVERGGDAALGAKKQLEITLQAMTLCLFLGDLPKYAALASDVGRLVESLPHPPRFGRLGQRLALCQLVPELARLTASTLRGEFDAANAALGSLLDRVRALRPDEPQGGDQPPAAAMAFVFSLFAYQGRLPMLEAFLGSAAPPAGPFELALHTHLALARGAADEARGHWERLRDGAFRRRHEGRLLLPTPQTLVLLADACVAIGSAGDARLLYETLSPFAAYCAAEGIAVALGSNARPLGELAAMLGDHAAAEGHFRAALEMNAHHRPETARTRLGLARCLAALGRTDEATRLRELAHADAGSIGMVLAP